MHYTAAGQNDRNAESCKPPGSGSGGTTFSGLIHDLVEAQLFQRQPDS
jgi:hypothetical protein